MGGNIESYAEVCEDAREEAYKRMVQHAVLGDDAFDQHSHVRHRFEPLGVTEVLAYGTAVTLSHK